MSGTVDGPRLLTYSGDPPILGQAATVTYLAEEKNQRLNKIGTLIKESKDAKKAANAKVDDLKQEIKRLEDKKDEVERLLKKFGFQTPDAGSDA